LYLTRHPDGQTDRRTDTAQWHKLRLHSIAWKKSPAFDETWYMSHNVAYSYFAASYSSALGLQA